MKRIVSVVVLVALTCTVGGYFVARPTIRVSPQSPLVVPSIDPGKAPQKTTESIDPGPSERGVYPFNRVVVVAIGINRYEALTGTADLRFAEADARAFAEISRAQYGYETALIVGKEATKLAIEQALKKYGEELRDRDALIIFFAGHGQVLELPDNGEAGYLIPADAKLDINERSDPETWATEAMDMQYLSELMLGMNAKHVLFLADACASGFMTKRGSLERWDLKTFIADRSRTVMTATTRRQAAREDSRTKHGYFTNALLEELNRGEAASVLDVHLPVLRSVAEATHGGMTPQLAHLGDGDGMFVFIPKSIPKEEIESDLQGGPLEHGEGSRGLAGVAFRARQLALQTTTLADAARAHEAFDYRFALDAEDRKNAWEARFTRFERNASLGDAWAMAGLHFCYHKGLGTVQNPSQAYHWARQADRTERPPGLGRYLLGRCYAYGLGVPVKGPAAEEAGLELYRESSDRGLPFGQYTIGRRLLRAKSPSKADVIRGRELLEKALAAGVLGAEVELALELNRARPDVPRDEGRSLVLLERAAQRDNPSAHFELYGHLIRGAQDVPDERTKRAITHLHRASDLGFSSALYELGLAYLDGDRGKLRLAKDDRRAFALIERAAQLEMPIALVQSARMLAHGVGVEKDFTLARARLEAAVREGLPLAEREQGMWLHEGLAYKQSHEEAFACFKRAASKDDAIACYLLGVMYCEGRGFQVRRRWEDTMTFHQDWHEGLHYLAKSLQLGLDDKDKNEFIRERVGEFRLAMLGKLDTPPFDARSVPILFFNLAAVDIANDWKSSHRYSFDYFCEQTGIDSKTLSERR